MSSETQPKSEYHVRLFRTNSDLGGELIQYATTVKNILLFSQIYLVAMAVAAVFTVMGGLSIQLNPAPVVIGLVTYAVYIGDRIGDAKEQPEATAKRAQFMRRHKSFFSISSAVAYGIAVSIAVLGGPFELAITLLPGLFWIFYASDRVPTIGLPLKRLKQVLILNSSLVAFAWAFAIVFLPIAFANSQITVSAVVLFGYFFLTMFVSAELSNIRDVRDDKRNGVSTLPSTFGIRRTRHVLYLLELLLVGLLGGAYFVGLFSFGVALAIFVGLILSLCLHFLVGRVQNHSRIAVFEEMKHIFVGVLLIGFGLF